MELVKYAESDSCYSFLMCVCAGGHYVHTVSLSLISTFSSEKKHSDAEIGTKPFLDVEETMYMYLQFSRYTHLSLSSSHL